MIAGRRTICWIACLGLLARPELRADDAADVRWRCPETQDGSCIPNPKSYGFYPTRWRKWPAGKTGPEPITTPEPARPKTAPPAQEPTTGTDELPPPDETLPPADAGEEHPDAMPAEPTESEPSQPPAQAEPSPPPTQPELPPELESNTPPSQDMRDLLPEEGPDEPPSPPAQREPKAIPREDDPFKDDPLPSTDDKQGAARRPSSTTTSGTGQIRWRPDPRLKQTVRAPAKNNHQIVLADAQDVAKPISKSAAKSIEKTEAPPARVMRSKSNPLRSATSGMVLPCPVADDGEVVPAADWSAEPTGSPAAATEAPAASWRANPLRATK